jgi:hypothetical protein
MTKEPREMFSAIFEKYDSEAELAKNSIQLFDIKSRKGGVIKDNLVFAEKEVAKMPKNLSRGDYVAFLTDLEFRNVEFMSIFEVGGSL